MFQKGNVLLIVLLIVGLLIGGYFLYGQTSDFPKAPKQIVQADLEAIQQAVAQHEGQSLAEIRVNFDNDVNKYENFATGQVGPASGMGGGARWVAAKVNGKWVIVDIGQVGVTCDLAGKYNLPKQMVPKCIDGDNVVDR